MGSRLMNSRAAEPVVIDALAARVATMSTLDLKADRAHRGNYEATTCFVRTWSRKRSALSGGFLILLPIGLCRSRRGVGRFRLPRRNRGDGTHGKGRRTTGRGANLAFATYGKNRGAWIADLYREWQQRVRRDGGEPTRKGRQQRKRG